MNRESKLHGNIICSECENLIKALEDEILNFDEKIEALKDFANNESEGEAAKAINEKSLELASVIGIMKEADEIDIEELKALADKVNDIFIDGDDVIERKETARREADSCYDRADSLWSAAQKAEFPWEADSLRGLASASKSQGDSWERIYEFWKGQEELYDTIDFETSSLFVTGIGLRRQANTKLASFLQCKLTPSSNSFTLGKMKKVSRKPVVRTDEEKIAKAKEWLKNEGFSNQEIEYIQKNNPDLLISLYDDISFRPKNKNVILHEIQVELDDFKKRYFFVLNSLKRELDITEKEAESYLFELEINGKLSSLWATYNYSQNDYTILLNNIVSGFSLNKNDDTDNYNEKDLHDVIVFEYSANENPGDVVTNLEDEKYQNMLDERSKLELYNWPSWEYTKDLKELGDYYSNVGIKNDLADDELTISCPGKKCDGMKVYNQNGYMVDSLGRYLITVGPKVLIPEYDVENEDFDISDFIDFIGCEIDVVLENDKDPSEVVTLKCVYGGDIKAHTAEWGEGICMSGRRYDNAQGAGEKYAEPDGSFIEFFGTPDDTIPMSGYSVKKIIVRK